MARLRKQGVATRNHAGRIKLLSRVSGSFLVGGGLWPAFSRAKSFSRAK